MNRNRATHTDPAPSALRREQLRLAKRRQREREKKNGLTTHQLRLPQRLAEKLKAGGRHADFTTALNTFIDDQILSLDEYENLGFLAWSRTGRFVTRAEAFQLYERNWRHVDSNTMSTEERRLIDELTQEFGKGVILA